MNMPKRCSSYLLVVFLSKENLEKKHWHLASTIEMQFIDVLNRYELT